MALGACRRDILWLVLKQGTLRIVIGLVLGVLAAVGASRVFVSILVNTTPTDPPTFISICLLLAAVTLLACFVPARRATRLHPVQALRVE
jgi:ABC-type antimicrobial peptide transport system permease subunit